MFHGCKQGPEENSPGLVFFYFPAMLFLIAAQAMGWTWVVEDGSTLRVDCR